MIELPKWTCPLEMVLSNDLKYKYHSLFGYLVGRHFVEELISKHANEVSI